MRNGQYGKAGEVGSTAGIGRFSRLAILGRVEWGAANAVRRRSGGTRSVLARADPLVATYYAGRGLANAVCRCSGDRARGWCARCLPLRDVFVGGGRLM